MCSCVVPTHRCGTCTTGSVLIQKLIFGYVTGDVYIGGRTTPRGLIRTGTGMLAVLSHVQQIAIHWRKHAACHGWEL